LSTLEEDRDTGDAAVLERAAGSGAWRAGMRAGRRWRAGLAGLPALLRRHWLFAAALGLAVVPRVIVMMAFAPAALFKLDTYDYLWGATHLAPNPVNPSGYSIFLWLLWPFHSLVLIAALQHLMGLGIAVMIYAVLRRRGVSGWLATLAAVPVLFDPAQFLLEQLIMADILAMFLMIAAFAVLFMRKSPSAWRSVSATLLMGASAVVRPDALPLIFLMAGYLLVRRLGWRQAGMALTAGLLPVAGYVAWFAAASGTIGLTSSDGLFLWSRTMSFANCAKIKPPPDLRALCPGRQPLAAVAARTATTAATLGRFLPREYLWDHRAWQWQPPAPGLVPDTAAFTPADNARARDFAIRAIEAQPLAYAQVVAAGVSKAFTTSDTLHFPGTQPAPIYLTAANRRYMLAAVRGYVGTTAGIGPYLGVDLGTHVEQPYAILVQRYQDRIHLPGPVFGLIFVIGLAGILVPRTRTAAAALLWASAAVIMILPVAEHEFAYRYVIPAVPLGCLAAALAARNRGKDTLA
jgi:Dolichyl-phosphate-mannose-protein mannosyltransferase